MKRSVAIAARRSTTGGRVFASSQTGKLTFSSNDVSRSTQEVSAARHDDKTAESSQGQEGFQSSSSSVESRIFDECAIDNEWSVANHAVNHNGHNGQDTVRVQPFQFSKVLTNKVAEHLETPVSLLAAMKRATHNKRFDRRLWFRYGKVASDMLEEGRLDACTGDSGGRKSKHNKPLLQIVSMLSRAQVTSEECRIYRLVISRAEKVLKNADATTDANSLVFTVRCCTRVNYVERDFLSELFPEFLVSTLHTLSKDSILHVFLIFEDFLKNEFRVENRTILERGGEQRGTVATRPEFGPEEVNISEDVKTKKIAFFFERLLQYLDRRVGTLGELNAIETATLLRSVEFIQPCLRESHVLDFKPLLSKLWVSLADRMVDLPSKMQHLLATQCLDGSLISDGNEDGGDPDSTILRKSFVTVARNLGGCILQNSGSCLSTTEKSEILAHLAFAKFLPRNVIHSFLESQLPRILAMGERTKSQLGFRDDGVENFENSIEEHFENTVDPLDPKSAGYLLIALQNLHIPDAVFIEYLQLCIEPDRRNMVGNVCLGVQREDSGITGTAIRNYFSRASMAKSFDLVHQKVPSSWKRAMADSQF